MIAFPAAAAAISLACALVVAWDGFRRPKPATAAWAVAFSLFAVATGAEVLGAASGWTPLLVRGYYLAGAVLVVGFLALGELYLLAPRRTATFGPGAALLVSAVAAAVVLGAPVDDARLAAEGWDALERGPALKGLAIGLNAGGTVVLVGGALYSAWRFWRRRIQRHRMIGCVLIAVGTLTVAAGGTLTRLGRDEYLYVAMATGVALIFAGYLETRRPDPARVGAVAGAAGAVSPAAAISAEQAPTDPPSAVRRGGLVPLPTMREGRRPEIVAGGDPAILFLEDQVLPLDREEIAALAAVWSIEPRSGERFDRDEARRVWALRLRLSPAAQPVFDALPVPTRRQLADLYHEVLAPGVADLDSEPRAVAGG